MRGGRLGGQGGMEGKREVGGRAGDGVGTPTHIRHLPARSDTTGASHQLSVSLTAPIFLLRLGGGSRARRFLFDNAITGTIPTQLGDLTAMEWL
jgi:hypothetical protein